MIAFRAEYDIKTTPEKAATFPGVWPISSGRNVMVKVKDTPTCDGNARTLQSDCNLSAREKRKMQTNLQHTKKCVHCNVLFRAKRKDQLFCSKKCGFAGGKHRHRKPSFTVVECVFCGLAFEKPTSLIREKNCCSLQCQNKWALQVNQHLNGPRKTQEEWLEKSKAAKIAWKKRSSRKRKRTRMRVWRIKCQTASMSLKRRRACLICDKSRRDPTSWIQLIKAEIVRMRQIRHRSRKDDWAKKCDYTARGLRSRRDLRKDNEKLLIASEKRGAYLKQLLLWA